MKLVSVYPGRKVRNHNRNFVNGFDQLFNDFFKNDLPVKKNWNVNQRPAVNVIETDDDFRIEIAAPGLSKKDFNLNLENDLLTISAKKETELKEGEKFTRREFNYTEFKRTFSLPETIDQQNIKANFKNGILIVSLAKKEEAKPLPARTIEIS